MIVSYNWLQKYFKEKLPAPSKVADAFTFGAFEVEGVEEVKGGADKVGDTAFDLKVLPDRACYALSHHGVAYELSAITGQPATVFFGANTKDEKEVKVAEEAIEKVSVTVADGALCRRYCARYIKNVSVGTSPKWLSDFLEAVGQRSINTIVDATNFVMLDIGQPLHAFDADKVVGGIVVRPAKTGEVIELLPEKGGTTSRNIELQETDLVITDDQGPIAIAGVKGGMRAAVTDTTKNLIIESANFDAVAVRKTSTRLALRNDASKRFENGLSVDLAEQAMEEVSMLIKELCPNASVGAVTDVFSQPAQKVTIDVTPDFISAKLGVNIPANELESIFSRLQFGFEKKGSDKDCLYTLTIPTARLDLTMPEDIVEEVGRIYGYEKITPTVPQKVVRAEYVSTPANNFAYWVEKVKDALFGLGFSEVQTSSFALKGEVEIQNPMASDKKFLRTNLRDNLTAVLEQNGKNAALLGLDEVKVFEIGTTFNKEGENINLGIGVFVAKSMKKKDQYIADVIAKSFQAISDAVGKKIEVPKVASATSPIAEINIAEVISTLPTPTTWDIKKVAGDIKYVPFSVYPFMVRDVAVFVPSSVSEKEVADVIDSTAGGLKVRRDLFDVFTKKFDDGEEKKSYAFHIVFQSRERTLVEDEVNTAMKNVSDALTAKSWQVR